jgi:hypothetical protein
MILALQPVSLLQPVPLVERWLVSNDSVIRYAPLLTFIFLTAAIYVAIYSARLTTDLPAAVVPAVEAAGLPATSVPALFAAMTNATALNEVPGISTKIIAAMGGAVMDANSSSFRVVYLSSLAFGGIAIISAFFATDLDKYLTNFVNKSVNAQEDSKRAKQSEKLDV